MQQRTIGPFTVSAIGLGAMPVSMNNDRELPSRDDAIAIYKANFWDKTKEVLATTNATTKAMLMSDVMIPDATTPAPADFGTFLDYVLNPMWSKGDGTIAATANEPGDSGTQNIY